MELQPNDFRRMSVEEFDTTKLLAHAARQAKERGYDRFPIVDVDSHHYENESMPEILDYLDDPVLKQVALAGSRPNAKNARILNTMVGYQDMGGRIPRYGLRNLEKTPPGKHQRDTALTKRWMDAVGVDIAVLFPTPMLALGVHPQVEVEIALSRAYNRWLCERVLAHAPRIKSMLYLPFNDPDACYQMVQEFGDRKGVVGFMVTSTHYRKNYENPYMRTYAALQERGLPIGFHAGFNWADQSLAMTNRFIAVHGLGFTWSNMVHMANWLVNGMPERFPKLKTIWIESGLAWIPFMMQRFDNEFMMRTSDAPLLKRKPSEYMREMYYSSQPMEMVDNRKALELTFEMINAPTQLLYSSDYPHWDMDLPSTIYDLPFLDMSAKRAILGGNAQKLFKLDPVMSPVKLARKAARVAAE
jgi:predicted TIM-barrel fold metal-dependent hydrolase